MSQIAISQEMGIAFAGMLVDLFDNGIESKVNSEASAEIGFGWAVTGGATDRTALKISSTGNTCTGIVVHSHSYAKGGNKPGIGTVGVLPKNMLNIMRHGRVWVLADDTVAFEQRAYYNFTTNRFAVGAGAGANLDLRGQVVFRTSGVAGGLVQVECDFVNKP